MKHIPNALSFSRILGAVLLLLGSFEVLPIPPLSAPFFVIYILCIISDLIDGPIARKTKTVTNFGSSLDSIADMVLIFTVLAIFIFFIPDMDFKMWMFVCVGIVIVIRAVSVIIGFKKFRAAAVLHTYSSKATSLILAAFPVFYWFLGIDIAFGIIAAAAIPSAIDELVINIRQKKLKMDVISMFHVNKTQGDGSDVL